MPELAKVVVGVALASVPVSAPRTAPLSVLRDRLGINVPRTAGPPRTSRAANECEVAARFSIPRPYINACATRVPFLSDVNDA